jgi:hypothetical protein
MMSERSLAYQGRHDLILGDIVVGCSLAGSRGTLAYV